MSFYRPLAIRIPDSASGAVGGMMWCYVRLMTVQPVVLLLGLWIVQKYLEYIDDINQTRGLPLDQAADPLYLVLPLIS
jgi:hypothetical protein